MTNDGNRLSEEDARAEARRRYLASVDYQRWSRVGRLQNQRFKSSVDANKPLFDFVRMVLTTALVVGLAVFIGKTATPGLIGTTTMLAVWSLAALLVISSFGSARLFASVVSTYVLIGLSIGYPSKRKNAATANLIALLATGVIMIGVAGVAWEVGAQAAARVQQPALPCVVET